jgi:hypothetical protein
MAGVVGVLFMASPSWAGTNDYTPITAFYFLKDPKEASGYKEKIHWEITNATDWENFYRNIPALPKDKSVEPDPFLHGAEDIIVLTRNDVNGFTGFDIYLSARGLTMVVRGANHYYYPDNNGFRKFLEEEQSQRSSFESFDHKDIDIKAPGVVVTYNVNQNIPNPTWLVKNNDDKNLYDSFLKTLKPYEDNQMNWIAGNENFDGFDLFVLHLNYPGAPAKIATVSKKNLRLSNPKVIKTYYQDTEDYFNYFKTQAREMMDYRAKYKSNESNAIKRSRF